MNHKRKLVPLLREALSRPTPGVREKLAASKQLGTLDFAPQEFGQGAGLGLAIAYGIVKQHEGYITVASRPGAGATFSVYLPLLDEADQCLVSEIMMECRSPTFNVESRLQGHPLVFNVGEGLIPSRRFPAQRLHPGRGLTPPIPRNT